MIEIESYMNDGANWQAQAVLAAVRYMSQMTLDLAYDKEKNYKRAKIMVGRYENCREQGYVLHVDSVDWDNPTRTEGDLVLWAFECRNSDNIVVSWQTDYPHNGMFSDDTYHNRRKYFSYNQIQEAANFMIDLVRDHFKNEFEKK